MIEKLHSTLRGFGSRLGVTAILCTCIFSSGCGGGAGNVALGTVTGKVTRGGKPLVGVSVTFTQTDKSFSAAGRTNDTGAFVLLAQNGKAGAMIGKNKVTLSMPAATGTAAINMSNPSQAEEMMKSRNAPLQGGARGAPAQAAASDSIPADYSNPSKTPLEYEVKAGANEFDIPIP